MISVSAEAIYRDIRVEPSELAEKLAEKYGYLPYMVQRYILMLGIAETHKLLEAFEKPVKPVVRANTLLLEPDRLASRLDQLGFILEPIPWDTTSYRVVGMGEGSPSIGATHEYRKGYYYVHRDSAPLVPSTLLVYEYRGSVLDTCAAPGGKTTHIAQLLGDKYAIVANDLVLYRIRALIGHILRMRIASVRTIWSDARKLPRLVKKRFGRVLVDAPCSGEGTIMIDPGRKTRTRLLDLARIVKREIEILWSSIEMLSEEGVLAYVTCSIAPEENEYVIAKILEQRNDIELVDPPIKLFNWSSGISSFAGHRFPREVEKCIRIWPHRHGMIGMTICFIAKTRR
ncbi:MAG: RsmB/NOP family class I SAM-dependent RNA methyltransferase [Thermoprotei archaeon]|nr:MAG: RsmB/NOP family class I SAM-dependent RNA methyltransferase [Thermoprotei archaeon]